MGVQRFNILLASEFKVSDSEHLLAFMKLLLRRDCSRRKFKKTIFQTPHALLIRNRKYQNFQWNWNRMENVIRSDIRNKNLYWIFFVVDL